MACSFITGSSFKSPAKLAPSTIACAACEVAGSLSTSALHKRSASASQVGSSTGLRPVPPPVGASARTTLAIVAPRRCIEQLVGLVFVGRLLGASLRPPAFLHQRRLTGVRDQRVEIAMMRTPDGHSRIELSRFRAPAIASDHRRAPVNSLGYLRVMFAVDDLDDTLSRLAKLGATVVDEVVNYNNIYRLCYVRGPEGVLIGLAQQVGP